MDGIINVLKPAGLSSHDVVQQIRKILKTKKVGHTGTLDPDAVGVLPICIGKATRLVEYLTASTKTYRALIGFGYETDTQDGSGQVIKRTELPIHNQKEFERVLDSFIGESEQIPPMFSAVKINGQPLYKLAREGKEIERKARKIHIYDLKLLCYDNKTALIEIRCSKGTYIRTLCQDLGRALNSSAFMSFLLRIQSGVFHIKDSFTLAEINKLNADKYLISMSDSLKDWPILEFNDEDLIKIGHGNNIDLTNYYFQSKAHGERYKVLDQNKQLLAVGTMSDSYFKPEKVFK